MLSTAAVAVLQSVQNIGERAQGVAQDTLGSDPRDILNDAATKAGQAVSETTQKVYEVFSSATESASPSTIASEQETVSDRTFGVVTDTIKISALQRPKASAIRKTDRLNRRYSAGRVQSDSFTLHRVRLSRSLSRRSL